MVKVKLNPFFVKQRLALKKQQVLAKQYSNIILRSGPGSCNDFLANCCNCCAPVSCVCTELGCNLTAGIVVSHGICLQPPGCGVADMFTMTCEADGCWYGSGTMPDGSTRYFKMCKTSDGSAQGHWFLTHGTDGVTYPNSPFAHFLWNCNPFSSGWTIENSPCAIVFHVGCPFSHCCNELGSPMPTTINGTVSGCINQSFTLTWSPVCGFPRYVGQVTCPDGCGPGIDRIMEVRLRCGGSGGYNNWTLQHVFLSPPGSGCSGCAPTGISNVSISCDPLTGNDIIAFFSPASGTTGCGCCPNGGTQWIFDFSE